MLIPEIHTDDASPDPAAQGDPGRVLQQRLQSVHDYLVLAATRHEESPEYVHQLRISTRRAIAAIDLFQDALTPAEFKWWKRNLRRVRRAAGNARDLDVFAMRYAKKSIMNRNSRLARRIRKRRRQATVPIRRLQEKLCNSGRFARQRTRLLETLQLESAETILSHSLTARLEKVYHRFLQAYRKTEFSKGRFSTAKLHRLRIRTKQLRYAIDVSADFMPAVREQTLYSNIRNLQAKLGDLNDHAAAAQRFEKWMLEADSRKEQRRLKKQLKFEREQLHQVRKALRKKWHTDFPDHLL